MRPRPLPFWGVIAAIVAIGAVCLLWAWFDMRQAQTLPAFTLTTYDGQTYHLADVQGKVVVLSFWASWCAPCHTEAPVLQQVWNEMIGNKDTAGNVFFLGADQADSPDTARQFINEFGLSFPNGPENGLVNALGVQSLPTTLITDRHGTVISTFYTAVDPQELRAGIAAALQRG